MREEAAEEDKVPWVMGQAGSLLPWRPLKIFSLHWVGSGTQWTAWNLGMSLLQAN